MSEQMFPEFVQFEKMTRLKAETVLITEKIDGTNAQIYITEDGQFFTGSRQRWITPESDNYGFSKWAFSNKDELMKLGPGRHFGEWWGNGIQRGYNLKPGEKRFSLFNVSRWQGAEDKPECCYVVPLLAVRQFDVKLIEEVMEELRINGSSASPGFLDPEGVVVYLTKSRRLFKMPFKEEHKGQVESG